MYHCAIRSAVLLIIAATGWSGAHAQAVADGGAGHISVVHGDLAAAFPQLNRTISLRLEGTSIEDAVRTVARESGLALTYNDAILPRDQKVWLTATDIRTDAALAAILRDSGLQLLALSSGQLVVVMRRPPVRPASPARAPDRQVTGRVTRATDGKPLPEASVVVQGRPGGTSTNADGQFTLSVPDGEVRLVVRAIGYARKEVVVPPGALTEVQVALEQDPFKLDELVVSGQQTTVESRNAPTSTAIVSGDELSEVPAPSIDAALQGKVAGANIQSNSGAPGGGLQVQIRGPATINAAADPLFVVDGVIYSNASLPSGLSLLNQVIPAEDNSVNRVADLNPSDIASIEILKGAAASSVYGSKAANGVVVITTNRGQTGKPRTSVTQRLGFFSLMRYPEPRRFDSTGAVAQFGAAATPYFAGGAQPFYDHFQDVAGNKPLSYETQASLAGGTPTTKYFASANVKQDNGIMNNTGAGRQSLRVNVDQTLSSRFNVNLSTSFNRTINDRGFANNSFNALSTVYDLIYIPTFISITPLPDGTLPSVPNVPLGLGTNPLAVTRSAENRSQVQRFTGGATFTFNALRSNHQDLRFIAAGGADLFAQKDQIYAPPSLAYEASLANPGEAVLGNADSRFFNWNANAIYTHFASGGFRSTTSAGVQYEDRQLERSQIHAQGLPEGIKNFNVGNVLQNPLQLFQRERTLAFYGQEEVLLMGERLLLSAGLRGERSSVFGSTGTYYVFPKFAGSYRFPNLLGEGGDLKLRAAYGETGNQPLFGQKYSTFRTGIGIGGAVGQAFSDTLGAAGIKPERLKEIEGGVDLAFLRGRATLQATVYSRRTTDLLLSRAPAASTGLTTEFANGGEIGSHGIELALGFTPVQTRNTNWLVRSTFQSIRTKVNSLPVPPFGPGAYGGGFGNILGNYQIQEGQSATQIVGNYVDANGTVQVGKIGDGTPNFRVSLTNDLTHKNLSFSMLWDWQQGSSVSNATLYLIDLNGLTADLPTAAGQARLALQAQGVATPYVQDASFLKLREITVGWQVPRRIARMALGADNMRLSLSGRNLLMFTSYFGFDPEVSDFGQQAIARGVDVTPYPPSRSYFLSLSVGF
jgi:TonB-linked SusC/RagA family outer membrane protein